MTTPSPARIAVLDFGSNSLKLSIFTATPDNRLQIVFDTREFTAIGDDAFGTGVISEAKAREVEQAIERLKAHLLPTDTILAAATSAIRHATNGSEMLRRFEQSLHAPIQLLSGLEEAALIAEGVLGESGAGQESRSTAAVLDIGGGSIEIIRSSQQELDVASFDLGAIRLREDYSPVRDDQPPKLEGMDLLDRYLKSSLEEVDPLPGRSRLFGSGGGFTTLGDVALGKENRSGVTISLEQIRRIATELRALTANQVVERYDLPLRRARIMAAGSLLAVRAMERLGVNEVTISWAGLREGLAYRQLRQGG